MWTDIFRPSSWDVSKAIENSSFSVSFNIESIFFKPDGSKMYLIDSTTVFEYDLSTSWDPSSAVLSESFTDATIDTLEAGFFKPDGSKMYLLDDGNEYISEYNLSTAWDVSTATFLQSFDATGANANGLFFRDDGLKMYLTRDTLEAIAEYDLGTAWDITTTSFLQSKSISAQTTTPEGLFFRSDGMKMYLVNGGSGSSKVFEYNLTDWDVSTLTFNQSLAVSSSDINTFSIFFSPDGSNMFVSTAVGGNRAVHQYDLLQSYTNVAKPINGLTIMAGTATGLIAPPTYSLTRVLGIPYTSVAKPTTSWSNVSKPT